MIDFSLLCNGSKWKWLQVIMSCNIEALEGWIVSYWDLKHLDPGGVGYELLQVVILWLWRSWMWVIVSCKIEALEEWIVIDSYLWNLRGVVYGTLTSRIVLNVSYEWLKNDRFWLSKTKSLY